VCRKKGGVLVLEIMYGGGVLEDVSNECFLPSLDCR